LGGGLRKFIRHDADLNYLINGCNGDRLDSRNLIEEWKAKMADKRHTFITSRDELLSLNISDYDHLFGIVYIKIEINIYVKLIIYCFKGLFNCDHLSYEVDRVAQNPLREPSLVELTEVAIKMLSRNPNGYFLLVEGMNKREEFYKSE
jgi:alkaline phosphatase